MATRQQTVQTFENGVLVDTRVITYETPPEFDNEETLTTRAEGALVDLRTLTSTTGTLTAAQLSNAVRLLGRVCAALVRLQLRRLDTTD